MIARRPDGTAPGCLGKILARRDLRGVRRRLAHSHRANAYGNDVLWTTQRPLNEGATVPRGCPQDLDNPRKASEGRTVPRVAHISTGDYCWGIGLTDQYNDTSTAYEPTEAAHSPIPLPPLPNHPR